MNSIAWKSTIGCPNCRRSFAKASDRSSARLGGADRPRADHDPLLDEPVLRELEPLADLAQDLVVADPDVLEREDRMLEHEGVHVLRRPNEPYAGRVLVDEEDRGLRGVAVHVGVDQEEVGDVAARHVPLLAVQDPVVAVAPRGRLHHRDVRAGAVLA